MKRDFQRSLIGYLLKYKSKLNFPDVHEVLEFFKEDSVEWKLTAFSLYELSRIRQDRNNNIFTWKTDPVNFKRECLISWARSSRSDKMKVIEPFTVYGFDEESLEVKFPFSSSLSFLRTIVMTCV